MYLYYEGRFAAAKNWVVLSLQLYGNSWSDFVLWYSVSREAHAISAADSGFVVLVDENSRSGQLYRLRRILVSPPCWVLPNCWHS